ncbi:hypothetical protein [Microcystis aeruginosa]|nr:hypothetical protein [Microcystis aeruginosa]
MGMWGGRSLLGNVVRAIAVWGCRGAIACGKCDHSSTIYDL